MHTNRDKQFPGNSSPPPEIPPLPEMAGAMPPPLPKPQVVTTSGKKTVLLALGATVVLLIGAVVAGVGLFWVTKRDLEVTPEHRAALHTAADLGVYLLMTGGVYMEEAEDLKEFLEPKLDAVERLNFGRK